VRVADVVDHLRARKVKRHYSRQSTCSNESEETIVDRVPVVMRVKRDYSRQSTCSNESEETMVDRVPVVMRVKRLW
jgi:predicted RNA-binding protein